MNDIPEKISYLTEKPNANYEAEIAELRTELQARRGVLVYLRAFPERSFLPSEDELRQRLELVLLAREDDGSIYSLSVEGMK